jgi:hypothetical protein
MDATQATINAGGTKTFNCTLTSRNGYQDTATLACTGLPAGFQYAFTPASVVLNNSPATCTLTITAPSTVPANNPTAFSVTASGGGVSQSANLSLTVTDFSVAVTPATPTLRAGGSTTATCSLTPINGFDGTVTFTCSGLPSGVQASFSPAAVTPNGGPVSTVMTLTASTSVAALRMRDDESPMPSSHAFGGLIWLALRDDKKRSVLFRRSWLLSVAVFLLLAIQASCGGGGGTNNPPTPPPNPKTYTVTVTASAGALSHAQSLVLTVNP